MSNTFHSCFLLPPYQLRLTRGSPSLQAWIHPAINRVRITRKEEVDWTLHGFVNMFLFPGMITHCVAAAEDLQAPRSAFSVHAHLPPPVLYSGVGVTGTALLRWVCLPHWPLLRLEAPCNYRVCRSGTSQLLNDHRKDGAFLPHS